MTPLVLESAGAPPLVSSSGAPAADALASAALSDELPAEIVTSPVALIERLVQASTKWFAIVTETATPIAASAPSVSPRAFVSAAAVCDALMRAEPVSVSVLPLEAYA